METKVYWREVACPSKLWQLARGRGRFQTQDAFTPPHGIKGNGWPHDMWLVHVGGNRGTGEGGRLQGQMLEVLLHPQGPWLASRGRLPFSLGLSFFIYKMGLYHCLRCWDVLKHAQDVWRPLQSVLLLRRLHAHLPPTPSCHSAPPLCHLSKYIS